MRRDAPMRTAEETRILRDAIEYDARSGVADAWDDEPVEPFPDSRPERERLEGDLCSVVQGREVLEVASGAGSLTRQPTSFISCQGACRVSSCRDSIPAWSLSLRIPHAHAARTAPSRSIVGRDRSRKMNLRRTSPCRGPQMK